MRKTTERLMPAFAMFSRRHIDLQRVAGALCPGAPIAATCPGHPAAASARAVA